MNTEYYRQLTVIGLVLVALVVLMMPLVRYWLVGWHAERADIMDGLDANAKKMYFKMFRRDGEELSERDAVIQMEQMYTRWYGCRLFFAPAIVLLIVTTIAAFLVFANIFCPADLDKLNCTQFRMSFTGTAAIAGAYMWVVNDFISRSRRLDFSPSDVHWGVLRLTIAIPMGYALAAIASPDLGPFVAFAAGAFPLSTLTKVLQRTALDKWGYKDAMTPESDQVIKLQGVNNDVVDRLANEDITTITQVAYCDPIRLTMRSNLTFNVVTDLMNQALAWEYLDDGMNKIRPFGLRGAVEIKHFMDALDGKTLLDNGEPDLERQKTAQDALPDIVSALAGWRQTEATLRTAFDEIVHDPFTDYLSSIWL